MELQAYGHWQGRKWRVAGHGRKRNSASQPLPTAPPGSGPGLPRNADRCSRWALATQLPPRMHKIGRAIHVSEFCTTFYLPCVTYHNLSYSYFCTFFLPRLLSLGGQPLNFSSLHPLSPPQSILTTVDS